MSRLAEATADVALVMRLDLRAQATGAHAVAADSIGPGTLADLQRQAARQLTAPPVAGGRRRLIDVGRVLVIDDAAAFAGHPAAYQNLLLTPTFGWLLCVTVGALADPDAIDLPGVVAADAKTGTGTLWIGDPVGTGWHLGMTTTTRLAESGGDPDGSATLEEILSALTDPAVYDATLTAITAMDGNVAAPAVLPVIRWPAADLVRLAGELRQGGSPPGPQEIAPVFDSDVRQTLVSLWSVAPSIARCERLLAEAERATRRLPWIPGLGGRRAWRAVVTLGLACAALGPAGPRWEPVRFPAGLAAQLEQVPRARTLWHPALVLGPLLVIAGAAGAGIARALSGQPQAAADIIAAACAAVILGVPAAAWWRRATRRWLAAVPLGHTRTALELLASRLAAHGVTELEEAAAAWFRAQQRRLISWWRLARQALSARIAAESAAIAGLPVAARQLELEPTTADGTGDTDLTDPELADIPQAVETVTAEVLTLLAVTALDGDFIQLTAPEQLPLLDGSSNAARLIRYAPASARMTLAAESADAAESAEQVPLSDVAWTTTGQTIGVLRLVPARPGVLRTADVTGASGTALQVEVSGGDDRAAEGLATWLAAGNDPDRQITLVDPHVGPVTVTLRSSTDCEPLVKDIIDWLRAAEEPAKATFTCTDGRTAIVSAAEAQAATNAELDAIAARVARQTAGEA